MRLQRERSAPPRLHEWLVGMPYRILHVLSHSSVKSGGAFQALQLARTQAAHGHDVRILHSSGHNAKRARASFASACDLRCDPIGMNGWRRLIGRRSLGRHLDAWQPDVVHTHRERAMRMVVDRLRSRPQAAFIVQKGNTYRSDTPTAAAFRSPRIDRIIAVAQAVKDVLVQQDGVREEVIDVVYGSFDSRRFSGQIDGFAVREELEFGPDAPVVGIVANLDRKKAHDVFFAMAGRVLRERPDVRFLVVGGGDIDEVKRLATENGALASTRFTGFRADAERYLSAMDVSVNCSDKGEGLTGAVRESLALGRPVVCTDVGGNRELVKPGETGELVGVGDADGLAAAVLRVLANRDAALAMAAEGRRRVHAQMTEEYRYTVVNGIYTDAVNRRRGSAHSPLETRSREAGG